MIIFGVTRNLGVTHLALLGEVLAYVRATSAVFSVSHNIVTVIIAILRGGATLNVFLSAFDDLLDVDRPT